ncbi:hypothetical protein C5167_017897 [Papaver somniferum]|uniref:Aminotransferase-like plant mobile domain-containing protein n=1 Tax=Papaver somniferum TaxID=3469 RepID=A0A4Y7IP23_PAPSO|nr:hypothetical protein C5167_017897 [Papaver somniferum]
MERKIPSDDWNFNIHTNRNGTLEDQLVEEKDGGWKAPDGCRMRPTKWEKYAFILHFIMFSRFLPGANIIEKLRVALIVVQDSSYFLDPRYQNTKPERNGNPRVLVDTHFQQARHAGGGEILQGFVLEAVGKLLVVFLCDFINKSTLDLSVRVDKRWCVVLDNLDVVGSYDWGTPSLGVLYKHLDDSSSCKQKDMGGMSMILEFLYYFYFRNFQPVLKENLKYDELDPHPVVLLFTMSNFRNMGQVDIHKHYVSDARTQIDMRMGDAAIWDPWFLDTVHQHNDAFQTTHEMSKRRYLFKDVKDGTRASAYLFERCMRQVLGAIVVPCNPLDWRTVGVLRTETTHIDTRDDIGVGHAAFYKDSGEDLVAVPRLAENPYNFSDINASEKIYAGLRGKLTG